MITQVMAGVTQLLTGPSDEIFESCFAAICHSGMIAMLVALPLVCGQLPLGGIYGCGVGAVAVLLIYEHWLVRPDDLARVNVAFFNVNAVVSVGLFAVGTLDLLT